MLGIVENVEKEVSATPVSQSPLKLSWRLKLARFLDKLKQRLIPPEQILIDISYGYRSSQLLYVAARLGLADLLSNEPKSVEELARQTGTDPTALFRLMRALTSLGIFAQDRKAPNHFRQTYLSEQLKSQANGSIRDSAIMNGERWNWQPWGELLHSVKTGEIASNHLFGKSRFAYFAEDTQAREKFDAAMTAASERVAHLVADCYDFSNVHKIVDVGGGQGTLLRTILQNNSRMQGILFDLPEVVGRNSTYQMFEESGLIERTKLVSGNFFEAIPAGVDVCILKSVIHNWEDEQALTILQNCQKVLPKNGKILLVEWNTGFESEDAFGNLVDLQLMVSTGGRVRTKENYTSLYRQAGFQLTRTINLPGSGMVIIEGKRLS